MTSRGGGQDLRGHVKAAPCPLTSEKPGAGPRVPQRWRGAPASHTAMTKCPKNKLLGPKLGAKPLMKRLIKDLEMDPVRHEAAFVTRQQTRWI